VLRSDTAKEGAPLCVGLLTVCTVIAVFCAQLFTPLSGTILSVVTTVVMNELLYNRDAKVLNAPY
jgi:hypothetical protein